MLRVLQERRFTRVGGSGEVTCDVRVIAASNRDLPALIADGGFREDLYYRLNVVPVELPPLRERMEDVPLLAAAFLEQASTRHGIEMSPLPPAVLRSLMEHGWPGNVRELANVLERLVLLAEDGQVSIDDLPSEMRQPEGADDGCPFRLPAGGVVWEQAASARTVAGQPRRRRAAPRPRIQGVPLPAREVRDGGGVGACGRISRKGELTSADGKLGDRRRPKTHSQETPDFLSRGSSQPRSGETYLAWGVSPRNTVRKNPTSREAATDDQKGMAAAHAAAAVCRPFRAPGVGRSFPGADAPGYGSIAPSALDRMPAASRGEGGLDFLARRLLWRTTTARNSFRGRIRNDGG